MFSNGEDKILAMTPRAVENIKGSLAIALKNGDDAKFNGGNNEITGANTSNSLGVGNSTERSNVRSIGARTPNAGFGHVSSITDRYDQTGVYNFNNIPDDQTNFNNQSAGTSFVLAFAVTFALVALVAVIVLCVVNYIYI